MNIYCMVDENLETLKPLRIEYRPDVLIDVILNEEPPLRTQDVKDAKKGHEVVFCAPLICATKRAWVNQANILFMGYVLEALAKMIGG
ncbi:hypothetical protein BGX21_007635 [Mortierella sp. AD011]|nr:hypothetical protein BGX21_007635 [Mortierella sp. AD011]